ncbi:unnamed protein product [Caenorhabditis brenneri]
MRDDLLIDYENVPARSKNAEKNETSQPTIVIPSNKSKPDGDFEPVEKQRHFGILHYAMTNRFKKVILIGLANVILIVTLFIFLVFVVLRHNNSTDSTGTTSIAELTTTTSLDKLTTTTTSVQYDTTAICADGFTMVNDKCWKLLAAKTNRSTADHSCFRQIGSTLITIKNSYENDMLAKLTTSSNVDKIWLGLTCEGKDKSSCQWDVGQGVLGDYSNFEKDSPNNQMGSCVYYSVSTKLWISSDCGDLDVNTVCELPTTISSNCKNNYNNNCYIEMNFGRKWDSAVKDCEMQCATFLAINSALENRFVQSVYFDRQGMMLIGCVAASRTFVTCVGNYTRGGYLNFDRFDDRFNCVLLDYSTGKWFNDTCDHVGWFMCKRPLTVNC